MSDGMSCLNSWLVRSAGCGLPISIFTLARRARRLTGVPGSLRVMALRPTARRPGRLRTSTSKLTERRWIATLADSSAPFAPAKSDQIEAQLVSRSGRANGLFATPSTLPAYHAIVPLVAEALLEHRAPEALRAEILRAYRSQVAHVLRLEAVLKDLAAVLEGAGVPFAVFKGAALAHGYYGNPLDRAYVDVDVLVRAEDLGHVDLLLRQMGCGPSGLLWPQAFSSGYGEILYTAPSGVALDVHWHPIREPAIRRAFSLATKDLLERSRMLEIDGASVPVLDAEDMLVVVCAHACYDGAYRLGWLVDVARIEQSGHIGRGTLEERCRKSDLGLPVQVILDRAAQRSGTPPEPFTAGLGVR